MKFYKELKYSVEFLKEGEADYILFKNSYNGKVDIETKDYLKNIIVKMLEVTSGRVIFENKLPNPSIYLKIYSVGPEEKNAISVLEKEFSFKISERAIEKEVWKISNEGTMPKSSLEEGLYWNINEQYKEGVGIDYNLFSKFLEELYGELFIATNSNERFDIIIPNELTFDKLKSYLFENYGIIFTKSIEPITYFFISKNFQDE